MSFPAILLLTLVLAPTIEDLGDPRREVRAAAVEAAVKGHAIADLRTTLAKDDWLARKTACIALARIGEGAAETHPDVLALLSSPDELVREAAATAVGSVRPAGAELPEALRKLLSDPVPEVRAAAARSAARFGPGTVPLLIPLLDDEASAVPVGAANGLAALGPEAAASVPALIRMMHRPRPFDHLRHAMNALVAIGDAAVPALAEDLRKTPLPWPAACLRRIGRAGVAELLECLRTGGKVLRDRVLYELDRLEADAPEAVPVLLPLLEHEDWFLRYQVAITLTHVDPSRTEALPHFIEKLLAGGKSVNLHSDCAQALGRMGLHAAPAIPALEKALFREGADHTIRASIFRALGQMGPAALPGLVRAFDGEDASDRLRAGEAAVAIGPPAFRTLLESDLLDAKSHRTGRTIAIGIRQWGEEALPALVSLLGHEERRVRLRAVWLLGGAARLAGTEKAKTAVVPALLAALKDEDLRPAARAALAQCGAAGVIELLDTPIPFGVILECVLPGPPGTLDGSDEDVAEAIRLLLLRIAAEGYGFDDIRDGLPGSILPDPMRSFHASAHREILAAGKKAVPAVLELLDGPEKNQRAIGAGLAWDLGETAVEAAPLLGQRIASEDPEIRLRAAQALGKMGLEGPKALPVLLDGLRAPEDGHFRYRIEIEDRASRRRSVAAIVGIGAEAVPAVGKATLDPDPWLRLGAAEALLGIGLETGTARRALVSLLGSKDRVLRESALDVFGGAGKSALRAGR